MTRHWKKRDGWRCRMLVPCSSTPYKIALTRNLVKRAIREATA